MCRVKWSLCLQKFDGCKDASIDVSELPCERKPCRGNRLAVVVANEAPVVT